MKAAYGLSETIKNAWSLLITRLCCPGARLIRRPAYIRGKAAMELGEGFTTGYRCRLEAFAGPSGEKTLRVGRRVKLGDNVHLVATEKLTIGDDCLFASNVFVSDTDHGSYAGDGRDSDPATPPDARPLVAHPTAIGERVWVGEGACILPGAQVGSGCVVAAHSVVKGIIPDNCVVAGAPARVVRRYVDGHWSKAHE